MDVGVSFTSVSTALPTTADAARAAPLAIPREWAETTLHARFEQQVVRVGTRLAIDSNGEHDPVTYEELNDRANALALMLIERTGFDDSESVAIDPRETPRVVILARPGVPLSAALLGVSKSGNAFVPLDPTQPRDRLLAMVRECGPRAIVAEREYLPLSHALAPQRCAILELSDAAPRAVVRNPGLDQSPSRLAHVLYTSGSTGRPKGVMTDHRSAVHNQLRHALLFKLSESDRQTHLYPPNVYGGLRDTLNALLNGASLHRYRVRELGHARLADWIEAQEITVFCSVATLFRHFARELPDAPHARFPSVRVVKLGGEATYRTDVDLFQKHFGLHGAMLSCGLGSTETGMTRHFDVVHGTRVDSPTVPLGYAMPGCEVVLLDENRQPIVGAENVGEIAIRSPYVTLGYLGRDDLNSQVVLSDPADPFGRIFLTGDLGKLHSDGCLVHRGRRDFQVKIRGNRVELPEVEVALRETPGVEDAAVIARPNEDGEPRLFAYVVPKDPARPITSRQLRESLAKRLPSYAIPSRFARLDALPQTSNAKIDRISLPDIDAVPSLEEHHEPVDPADARVATISNLMARVLGRERVSADDDFFDLGGDSLLVVKLVLEVERAMSLTLPISAFYDAPSPRRLASKLREVGKAAPSDLQEELVTLCAGTDPSLAPLICLPGRGGTAFTYRAMVARLDDASRQRAIVGLQYPGLDGRGEPIADLPQLAADMIRRVRTQFPSGPYMLIGYSYGGAVAFEMARQLRDAGEHVDYVGIIDATAPGAIRNRSRPERAALHVRRFLKLKRDAKVTYLRERWKRLSRRLRGKKPRRVDVIPEQNEPFIGTTGQVADWLRNLRRAADIARSNWKPAPANVRVTLFRTALRPEWLEFCVIDPSFGWSKLATQGITQHDLPGRHEQVFHDNHVGELAAHVARDLTRQA
jgi:amino acid adenylation domain-containing protein